MSEIKSMYGFKLGDKVVLKNIEDQIVDRNRYLKIGDTGTIVCFHNSHSRRNEQVTISWDRPGVGDSRQFGEEDENWRTYPNCWAVDLSGVVLEGQEGEDFNPVLWKIKTMWNRQPYMQKQIGESK